MRKILRLLLILLWILWIGSFVVVGTKYGWATISPVIVYNRPHGIFGWSFTIIFWLSAAHFTYFHLVDSK
ncbi:hypothetical protein [Companilactobacillus kedongensis]|uniref:hypothetical protein n=1 Tax=Companilactobacillus kedongensis TaxID=2486004 RepID=UPI000F782E59|nr:hypothetical protein [Companilactobacillus kedongensis]